MKLWCVLPGGAGGSAKFLDEFLTWRELSYSWCHEVKGDMHSHAVLPQWAQDTLAAHAGDERDVKTLEQLEKGATGDQGWDAMQHQLVLTGVSNTCSVLLVLLGRLQSASLRKCRMFSWRTHPAGTLWQVQEIARWLAQQTDWSGDRHIASCSR